METIIEKQSGGQKAANTNNTNIDFLFIYLLLHFLERVQ